MLHFHLLQYFTLYHNFKKKKKRDGKKIICYLVGGLNETSTLQIHPPTIEVFFNQVRKYRIELLEV